MCVCMYACMHVYIYIYGYIRWIFHRILMDFCPKVMGCTPSCHPCFGGFSMK